MNGSAPIRILTVDGHPMVRATLAKAEGDTDGDNFGWTYGTVVAEPGANACGAAERRVLAPLIPDGEEPRNVVGLAGYFNSLELDR
jgi:hypothetical protein